MKYRVINDDGEVYGENLTLSQAKELQRRCYNEEEHDAHIEEDTHKKSERKLLIWAAIAGFVAALVGL